MRTRVSLIVGLVGAALVFSAVAVTAQGPRPQAVQVALGPEFTYHGQLRRSGVAVNDICNIGFSLYDAALGGTQIGTTQTIAGVSVSNGLFVVPVNASNEFGANAFNGQERWLQIAVQCTGDSSPVPLTRELLTAVPYAQHSLNDWALAGNAGTTSNNFLGTTDSMSLTIGVSNTAALRIYPNSTSPDLIGGSQVNTVTAVAEGVTIGGGGAFNFPNTASGNFATIGGGAGNSASGPLATVVGGSNNTASGPFSTVSGADNHAAGSYSFAAGRNAWAQSYASFVWSDDSCACPIESTAPNQFLVWAGGGMGVGTTAPLAQVHVSSGGDLSFPPLRVSQTTNDESRIRMTVDNISPTDGTNNRWDIGASKDQFDLYSAKYNALALKLTPGDGNVYMLMGNGAYLSAGGAWSPPSDRNAKMNFASVDTSEILAKVASLPIQTWSYKAENASIRHLGPMAQDFSAAFGLGQDDKHISTVDEEGVALAAIQGLYQLVQEQQAEIALLKTEGRAVDQSTHASSTAAQTDVVLPALVGLSLLMNVLLGAVVVMHLRKGSNA